jgi:hypothetical protein
MRSGPVLVAGGIPTGHPWRLARWMVSSSARRVSTHGEDVARPDGGSAARGLRSAGSAYSRGRTGTSQSMSRRFSRSRKSR